MQGFYWLILFILLLIIEIVTLGLTTIWFAGGALVAFISSFVGAGLEIQILLFFVVSLVLLFSTRPIAVKYLNSSRIKTNVDRVLNEVGRVTETIDNKNGKGKVIINGQDWTARSLHDEIIIQQDSRVKILQVSGVKLIVEQIREEKDL